MEPIPSPDLASPPHACVPRCRPQDPSSALRQFNTVLGIEPHNIRALYGKAVALDTKADATRSNEYLDQAIEAYRRLLLFEQLLDDAMLLKAANRCIDRMRFRGDHLKAVEVHYLLLERFPNDPQHHNNLAVTHLSVNRISYARHHFQTVLKKWPGNGFALAHLGFILKNVDNNLRGAVSFLKKGIATREEGTIDARFFFHLSDALTRLGQLDEAAEVNRAGVREGLFLSESQRSLYNVDRLTARPWWTLRESTYENFFEMLQKNWRTIRNEAMAALKDKKNNVFKDEMENLKDVGNWKQLQLFIRGRKMTKNCLHTPKTCDMISGFPAARDCRRGQVKFSVVEGGTHVFAHCGPTNCRLRAHLGLVVPPGATIRVAKEARSWKEGKVIIFDDSFEHEVWHNGTSTRLILIIDVWHPELTEDEKQTLPSI